MAKQNVFMEYHTAIKDKLEIFVGKWMKLEKIMLGETSQTHGLKYHMVFCIWKHKM